jgi:hypothetical protein
MRVPGVLPACLKGMQPDTPSSLPCSGVLLGARLRPTRAAWPWWAAMLVTAGLRRDGQGLCPARIDVAADVQYTQTR